MRRRTTNLDVEQVELDGVVAINVLIREEELFLEENHLVLVDALLAEGLLGVEPCGLTSLLGGSLGLGVDLGGLARGLLELLRGERELVGVGDTWDAQTLRWSSRLKRNGSYRCAGKRP